MSCAHTSGFICRSCQFTADDRDDFETFGKAMACPECQSLRVEHDSREVADNPCPCCGGTVKHDNGDVWVCVDCDRSYNRNV